MTAGRGITRGPGVCDDGAVSTGSGWIHAGCGGRVVFDLGEGYCTGCEAEGLTDIVARLAAVTAERDQALSDRDAACSGQVAVGTGYGRVCVERDQARAGQASGPCTLRVELSGSDEAITDSVVLSSALEEYGARERDRERYDGDESRARFAESAERLLAAVESAWEEEAAPGEGIRGAQERAWANKVAKGFNTSDVPLEFCLLSGEVAEAFDAWRRGGDGLGGELADVFIYLAGVARMTGIDLEAEIGAKLDVVEARTYVRLPNGTPVKEETS